MKRAIIAALLLTSTATSAQVPPAPPPAGRVAVRELLLYAYELLPYQLIGAPEWTAGERVEIRLGPDDFTRPRQAVQRALADRFSLRVRRETRDLPRYSLRFADGSRRPGPRLQTIADPLVYGASFSEGAIVVKGMPWGFLHPLLGASLGRVVIDETGLSGPVDLALEWTDDVRGAQQAGVNAPVDLFTALYEQLGLTLVSTRGPVEVVVVERIVRPR